MRRFSATAATLVLTLVLFAPTTSSALDEIEARALCWRIIEAMATYDVDFSIWDPTRVTSTSTGLHAEGNAKFQNGFGAWMKRRFYCDFDRQGKALDAGLR